MTLAWHFVGATLRDGRPIPADGETLRHEGPLVLCESGLHASERLIDALAYAPGETLCRAQMGGSIERQHDKLAATERTILWRFDATDMLRAFARRCALDVAHLWQMPDVVRRFLETGDESVRAAARAAADAAAYAAAAEAAYARAAAYAAATATAAQNDTLTAMAMAYAPKGAAS